MRHWHGLPVGHGERARLINMRVHNAADKSGRYVHAQHRDTRALVGLLYM